MAKYLALILTALCFSPAWSQPLANSVQNGPTISVTPEFHHAGVVVRAMMKAYEHYLTRGDLERADNFLESVVGYTRFQSAKFGLTPEQFLISTNAGIAQTWKVLVEQAAAVAGRPRAAEKPSGDEPDLFSDCHRDSDGDFSCITTR